MSSIIPVCDYDERAVEGNSYILLLNKISERDGERVPIFLALNVQQCKVPIPKMIATNLKLTENHSSNIAKPCLLIFWGSPFFRMS